MWPDTNETQELLHNAKRGDESAINELMDRHRQSLRQMIQLRMDRALSQRVDASDVVQDVLLEANRRLSDYINNAEMPFHLWLRQLAKDRIIDMHRRHRVAQKRSVDRERPLVAREFADRSSIDLAQHLLDRELTPAAANIRRELEQRFFAALEQTNDEDREIIIMRHCEQLSNSEVAIALGMTPPAAGMRYLRAIRRLRALLGENNSTGETEFNDATSPNP